MADLNPQAVVRDVSSSPSLGRQVHDFIVRVTGGGTNTITIETKLKSILMYLIYNETDNTVVAGTVADSTVYSGTKKIYFTSANPKVYSIRITGILGTRIAVSNYAGGNADLTVTYEPLKGQ
jgi:hypothetical protein